MPAATSFPHARGPATDTLATPPVPPAGTGQPRPAQPVVLDRVTKRYGRRRGVLALQDVSASFPAGSLTAVMGISGSGKSTLLQCAAGLDKPTAGTVHLAGVNLSELSRKKLTVLRRRRVGFVFQSLNLVPTLSVAENIALPLRLDRQHVRPARIRALVTHDPAVTRYADAALFLDRGRVALVTLAPDPAQVAAVLRDLAGVPR